MVKRKTILIFLSALTIVSSTYYGINGVLKNTPFIITSAEETVENQNIQTLSAGTYVAPLIRGYMHTDNYASTTDSYYGQAMITISEDGTQQITIAVENWSFYDAFVPLKQDYNSNYSEVPFNVFPEKLLKDNENLVKADEFCKSYPNRVSSDINDWFNYGDTKYGDIIVEEYDENLDVAYVSFNIDDYKQKIGICGWYNTPGDIMATLFGWSTSYANSIVLYIDTDKITNLSDIKTAIENNTASFKLLKTSTGNKNTYVPSFTVNQDILNVFENKVDTIINQDGSVTATYYVNSNGSNFRISSYRDHSNDNTYLNWNFYYDSVFDTNIFDETEQTITITYDNDLDIAFGEYLFFDMDNLNDNFASCMPYLSIDGVENFTLTDEETGIYVETNTLVMSKDTKLVIEKNQDIVTTDGSIASDDWKSSVYSNSQWYTIKFIDESGNEITPVNSVTIYVPLPTGFNTDDYYTEILNSDGSFYGGQNSLLNYNNISYDTENNYWSFKGDVSGKTFAIMQTTDTDNVFDLKDGIYSANAYLFKANAPETLSMSNAALNSEVYLVIENGEKKLYFKANAMKVLNQDCYIGDIYCNNLSVNGEAFKNSVSYTEFLIDDKGELVGNSGYDAITEWACVKGGILTLLDDSYNTDEEAYSVVVASPAMASMSNTKYENVVADSLTALLKFTDVQKVSNVTAEEVQVMFPYTKSALLRQIRLAQTYYNTSYDEILIDELKEIVANAQTIYDTESSTSSDYKVHIDKITDAIKGLSSNTGNTGESNNNQDNTNKEEIDEKYNNLEDGKYKISAEMFKTDRESKSMSDNAINHTAILEVVDGEYYLTLEFTGLSIYNQFGYLSSLSYYDVGYEYNQYGIPQGTLIPADILSTYDVVDQYNTAETPYPHELKIKLVDKASVDYVPLQVFVPIMESITAGSGTQDVLMQLDWDTLKVYEETIIDTLSLEQLVATAKAIKQDNYTNESYSVLTKAIEIAESYLTREDITQEDIDNQVKNLQSVIDGLVENTSNQEDNIVINILRLKKYILGVSTDNGKLDYNQDEIVNTLDLIIAKNNLFKK